MSERNTQLWPVYEFRPLPNDFVGEFHRYAGGEWVPDDGEYDIAFAGFALGRFPTSLYVSLPYKSNIIWSGLTTHWSSHLASHPKGNPWHYMLRDGATECGDDWGRDYHENYRAGRSGMNRMASLTGCANGRHVEFQVFNPHITAGLLRDRETKQVVVYPETLVCMHCGEAWDAALAKPATV